MLRNNFDARFGSATFARQTSDGEEEEEEDEEEEEEEEPRLHLF